MITRYLFWAEAAELEYTDEFHAHITFESCEHGLRCDISLCNDEDELFIGTIISKEYDMDDTHQYAENMLSDKDYCLSVWRHHHKRKKKGSNATR